MANLADLFAEIWLMLQGRINEVRALDNPDAAGTVAGVVSSAKAEATELVWLGLAIDEVADKLHAWAGDDILKLMAAAQAIDDWYAPLGEDGGRAADLDDAHTAAKHFFITNHRLNEDEALGQVILRRPLWGRWSDPLSPRPEDALELSDLFDTLVLLPNRILGTLPDEREKGREIAFQFRRRPGPEVRPLDGNIAWKIGFAPIAQTEKELEITYPWLDGRPAYDAQVAKLDQRLEAVIETLCMENCHVIALPEMALHEASLESLRAAIKKYGPDSNLVLVLAGTRRVPSGPGKPPFNEGVILDHVGEEVIRQRKLARWNLDHRQCEWYDLPKAEGGIRYEYITPGDEMVVVEQPGLGRLAVLVCEDLGRTEPGRWIRSNLLLDLQFTPVLDWSLKPKRWNAKEGGAAARSGRCRVIVANSLPLTLRCNQVNKNNPEWVIERCGIGLGIDVRGNQARYKIARVPLDKKGHIVATLTWKVADWKALKAKT